MTKAFLYHPIGGKVVRCICAGLDGEGQPRWVNVTPGEKAESMIEIDEKGSNHGRPLMMISVDDEIIPSVMIAKVLAEVMQHPGKSFRTGCIEAISRMKRIGMKWDDRPISINLHVYKENGKYCYVIKEDYSSNETLTKIDGVFAPDEMCSILNWYFMALELNAEIPIKEKTISVNSQLKKELGRRLMGVFDRIEKEES